MTKDDIFCYKKDFFTDQTVYPVTPNAGMFYQRGYKHLRRGNTQGKKTCNSRISIVPFSNITFQTLCKRAFLRNYGASKQ